ncbi:tRNA (adenosine(37)-N6)-threonylcarbamoyltransferase complex dimerization subunit type 1 TsaB [Bacteroidota bacterium]
MAIILHIETATDICSVALSQKEEILCFKTVPEANLHSAKLTLFIDEIMHQAGLEYSDLDAVSVSMGPGSFTGLRIGVAVAKGICFGLNKPLIGVSTLQALVVAALRENKLTNELICSLIDARNNEVYYALYNEKFNELIQPDIGQFNQTDINSFLDNKIIFVGDGVLKWTADFRNHPNAIIQENMLTDARNLVPLALRKYNLQEFEEIASFEPYYLRDFKAKKGFKIKKILNI